MFAPPHHDSGSQHNKKQMFIHLLRMDIFSNRIWKPPTTLPGLTVCKNEVRPGELRGASISYDSSLLTPKFYLGLLDPRQR